MAEVSLQPITLYSNWCLKDQLDGRDLEDGERLRILWPDGSESEEVVRVSSSSSQVMDMGHASAIPVSVAYVERVVRGQVVPLWLGGNRGVLAERVPGPDAWWDARGDGKPMLPIEDDGE